MEHTDGLIFSKVKRYGRGFSLEPIFIFFTIHDKVYIRRNLQTQNLKSLLCFKY